MLSVNEDRAVIMCKTDICKYQQHPPFCWPLLPAATSFKPKFTVLAVFPACALFTPLLLSLRSYFPASIFWYILSATSKNALSTPSPDFALVSTYCKTLFCLHQSSASSLVTSLKFLSSSSSFLPDADFDTVEDGARSDLFPTNTTTIPSSAICRKSFNHEVALRNVDLLVMSKTSNAPLAPRK